MPKKPSASDLASLRVPTDVRLSPDGRFACFVVKENTPDLAGYRTALWLAPVDGSEKPRRLTLGANHDAAPHWSPDVASWPSSATVGPPCALVVRPATRPI